MRLLKQLPIPLGRGFRPFRDDEIEQSITRRFEQQAQAYGDKLAIEWDGGRYSFTALNERANRLARKLLSRRGHAAEPVALLFDHGGEAVAAILAVLKAGKFYVVLDPGCPADRLKFMLDDSDAKLLVTDASHLDGARSLCGSTIELIDFGGVDAALSGADLAYSPAPESLAMLLYTSGSTGHPKGVVHTHRNVLADARNLTNGWGLTARDRWVVYTSLSFASSVRTVFGSLLNGGALFFFDVRRGSFGELAACLVDNGITILRGVPTFFRTFMATLEERQTFPAVRVLSVGGEPMLQADLAHFNRHFSPSCVLVHMFGPTECLTVCWALVAHGAPTADGKLPIGYSLRDKDVLLLDESRRAVGDGEVGEISVRSRYLSPGYWRDPDRTGVSFLPDPAGGDARIYLTGDFGMRAPDGRLEHIGRKDFQVKIRGFRVEVSEIENALRTMTGICDAVVVGRETDPGEQRLIAYYVASAQPPISASALREGLAQKLPDYMIPSVFVAIGAIPKTPNGKTDRLRLPLPVTKRRNPDASLPGPNSAVEAELRAIWAAVLRVDQVEADDTFLNLGGDSLKAAAVAARVAARFKVVVSVGAVLDSGSVAQMARAIRA